MHLFVHGIAALWTVYIFRHFYSLSFLGLCTYYTPAYDIFQGIWGIIMALNFVVRECNKFRHIIYVEINYPMLYNIIINFQKIV